MPIEVILTTLLLATITGWAVTWRDLKRENTRLFFAATHAANERNEAMEFASRVRAINHQLGAEMQAHGLGVALVGCGEPDCENCADADEWPSEIEVNR